MPKIIPPDHTGTEIYRRHRPYCRNHNHCDCPIWIYGYVVGVRVQESLKTRRMDIAVERQRRREKYPNPRAPLPLPERLRAAAERIGGLRRADIAVLLREAALYIEESKKGQ